VTTATGNAIVIGGGFYGCAIAVHLARRGLQVRLFEKAPMLLSRASYVNQARLHNGYHYPRSFRTAMRSHANLPLFRDLYGAAVDENFRALYAVANGGSKVGARHFQRFCAAARIPLKPAKRADRDLFDKRLIDDVFEVEEPAFNADALRQEMTRQMTDSGVRFHLNTTVENVGPATSGGRGLVVRLANGEPLEADWVFNCTYAALNHIGGGSNIVRAALRHQIAQVALIHPPAELHHRGVTLMDGPFFSSMPFPARQLHSLTHVRYTHHVTWAEDGSAQPNPLDTLQAYLDGDGGRKASARVEWMLRDAARFVPVMAGARHVESLFEIKTLVAATQIDDARPILFQRDRDLPGFVSVLGAKIDNIFDVLSYVDEAIHATH
jgi:glycine/D-amino acid oxidase-like deaminating enzyme